ncbi:MAG: hypothetical protein HY096_02690 [Nitrospinae bacterium]|nr:hypothetical protein [Nitrospinota bacterium]
MDKEFHQQLEQSYSRYKSAKEIKDLCYRALIDSYRRVKDVVGIAKLDENNIRNQFIIDLETKNEIVGHALENHIIRIIPESCDLVKRKRPDIVFFIPHICDLTFECKKLTSDEDRYLNDGLIRFIRLDYAEKEDEAGMIGFILDSSIPSKLKKKVSSFHCIRLIDKPVLDFLNSFWSKHTCQNSKQILISHLFFYFSKNKHTILD